MNEINIRQILAEKNSVFFNKIPSVFKDPFFYLIDRILHVKEINSFIGRHKDKKDFELIDELFEELDVSYKISAKDKLKIPSEGKLIIVSNHPLGGLDGLILLKLISEVRKDVKIIVNDVLLNIDNLKNLFLPFDITNNSIQKINVSQIIKALNNEEAIIIFPAGEVSRLYLHGIMDSKWNKGVIYFAEKFNVPILPVWIEARNSLLFYMASWMYKSASTFLLAHELFNKRGKTFNIKAGNHILPKTIKLREDYKLKYLRKHTYLIGKGKKGIFTTEKNVIHPVSRKELRNELSTCELLGTTEDGKKIYLSDYENCPAIMSEIARLREITFRKVGEGTGGKSDTDFFDKIYKHLILWDDKELEIAGAYRIGLAGDIHNKYGGFGLYTSTLFDYTDELIKLFPEAIELGRSFVQQKYWNTFALDYLWQGLGAFISKYPAYKYLFGPVSISSSYPEEARELIVFYFNKYFGRSGYAESKNKFLFSEKKQAELANIFNADERKPDYRILKERLKYYGCSVPVLFKQYTELCDGEGVIFFDFGTDKDFQNCVDGLIMVNIDMIKESKKERYFSGALSK